MKSASPLEDFGDFSQSKKLDSGAVEENLCIPMLRDSLLKQEESNDVYEIFVLRDCIR